MGCQGLAPGEVQQLDVDDVDLVGSRLHVAGGGHGRRRNVKLTPATLMYLAPYVRGRPLPPEEGKVPITALFLTREGTRLAGRTIRTIARRHGVNGLELRRRFIRTSLDDGADPRALSQELGLRSAGSLYETLEYRPHQSRPAKRKAAVAVVAMPARAWDAEPLRQWTLAVLERECERWLLRGVQRVPPGFRWPPLPSSDVVKLKAAEGRVVGVLNIVLEQLMA